MQSKAATVSQYLRELPPERRDTLTHIRKILKQNLPKGFKEGMQYGMISYFVPHRLYTDGYHCDPAQPLPYISLVSQKNYCSLYLFAQYSNNRENHWFQKAWKASDKKMNRGKSCVRFKKLEDLPLDVIAEAASRLSVEQFIEIYESVIKPTGGNRQKSTKRAVKQKTDSSQKKTVKKASSAKTSPAIKTSNSPKTVVAKQSKKTTPRRGRNPSG
tara:strand:- start:3707 stop:4351 length:645 start_codon:yes stop_codon:yes gene_type:complete